MPRSIDTTPMSLEDQALYAQLHQEDPGILRRFIDSPVGQAQRADYRAAQSGRGGVQFNWVKRMIAAYKAGQFSGFGAMPHVPIVLKKGASGTYAAAQGTPLPAGALAKIAIAQQERAGGLPYSKYAPVAALLQRQALAQAASAQGTSPTAIPTAPASTVPGPIPTGSSGGGGGGGSYSDGSYDDGSGSSYYDDGSAYGGTDAAQAQGAGDVPYPSYPSDTVAGPYIDTGYDASSAYSYTAPDDQTYYAQDGTGAYAAALTETAPGAAVPVYQEDPNAWMTYDNYAQDTYSARYVDFNTGVPYGEDQMAPAPAPSTGMFGLPKWTPWAALAALVLLRR